MNPCDFCSNSGKAEDSSAYCAGCQKYMCVACWKLHAEILSDHRLSDRTKIHSKEVNTFEDHTGEELEWFSENYVCLLCNVCKMVDHQQCTLRKIEDIVAEKDVIQEFENNLADLVRLSDIFNERIDKTKKDIDSYSKKTAGVIEKISDLQRVLNQIFEKFKTDVGAGEAENMEMLQAKLISYQMIESHLGVIKSIKLDGRNDIYIFTSAIKMKKKVSKFTALSQRQRVQIDIVDGAKLVIKDTKLPKLNANLIRELKIFTVMVILCMIFSQLPLDQTSLADLRMESHLVTNTNHYIRK